MAPGRCGPPEQGRDYSDDRPWASDGPLVRVDDPWRQRVNPGARQNRPPSAGRGGQPTRRAVPKGPFDTRLLERPAPRPRGGLFLGATLYASFLRWRGTLFQTRWLLWFFVFAVGLAVYYRLNGAQTGIERRLVEFGLVAVCAAGLLTEGRNTATAGAFGLALVALRPLDRRVATARWLLPLRACGRRCYSIYLAHLPVGVVGAHWLHELGLTSFWARALIVVPLVSAAGVAVGWVFRAAVESHFLGHPPWHGRRVNGRLAPGLTRALSPSS